MATLQELELLPRTTLVEKALEVGLTDVYGLAEHQLARAILIRIGESAEDKAWEAAPLASKVIRLQEELNSLRAHMGRVLTRLEERTTKNTALAEAAVISSTYNRAPTPKEIGELSDQAVSYLAAGLGIEDRQNLSRAAQLNMIAEKLNWSAWKNSED